MSVSVSLKRLRTVAGPLCERFVPTTSCTVSKLFRTSSAENDTSSYALHVASAIGRAVDERIPFDDDPTYYLAIAKAIARHECGADAELISSDVWEEAYKMASPLS